MSQSQCKVISVQYPLRWVSDRPCFEEVAVSVKTAEVPRNAITETNKGLESFCRAQIFNRQLKKRRWRLSKPWTLGNYGQAAC